MSGGLGGVIKFFVKGIYHDSRKCVGYIVVLTLVMTDVSSEFSDVGKVSLLSVRPRVSYFGHHVGEELVVCVHSKTPDLQEVSEIPHLKALYLFWGGCSCLLKKASGLQIP